MAIVTDVRENRGMVELTLDGVKWLRIRRKHFSMRPVEAGEALDPDFYLDSLAAVQAADCYEAALTMLDQAAQASGSLRAKLIFKGFVAPAADAAVERLIGNGLVDDGRYAERMAQAQLSKPVGAYAVRRKLRAKRLPEEAIDAAMDAFDDEQQKSACRSAAEKLWRKYADLPSREGRAKLSQALARRGFSWDAISGAMDQLSLDSDDFEE